MSRSPRHPEARAAGPEGPPSLLSADDLYLFNQGTHYRLYDHMGAHLASLDGVDGVQFAVWAPNADHVSVVGDFNGWRPGVHALAMRGATGVWEGFVPGIGANAVYKFHLASRVNGYKVDKADPFGFKHEAAPSTASIVTALDYEWNDGGWMAERRDRNAFGAPMSIYEVHLGSFMRGPNGETLLYSELAPRLVEHVRRMGFTHVEFLPVMEHPYPPSWGYQSTGYFAPTSRFGSPQDFMYLVDALHQAGIGVILDWVPSHFPSDEHGLHFFDGTHLYEHEDTRKGFHPDWKSWIFNFDRNEVRCFLVSSAMFWLEKYHIDGLRVDAVASMLYLDYSRKHGEWIPNVHGGRENLGAIALLRDLNKEVFGRFPETQTIAEESTAWPMVSRPVYVGGLGFGMKWDMGWMHDTLSFFQKDPVFRKYHHNQLTFRMMYAFNENFVLPLSHDEVVHGKGSLLNKMPGDDWQKFANLRLLFGYMYALPAKKLVFMGGEFGQRPEWNHDTGLDWHVLGHPLHGGCAQWVADLNGFYRENPAMHQLDLEPGGFRWIDCNDWEATSLSLLRVDKGEANIVAIVCNFTPVPRYDYRVGVPRGGTWTERLNSDATVYGGSGVGNGGAVVAEQVPHHAQPFSVRLTLPPLAMVCLVAPPAEPQP